MKLSLHMYESPDGGHLANWSNRARGTVIENDEQGELALRTFVPMSERMAFGATDHYLNRYLRLGGGGQAAWQGRIEDLQPVEGGLRVLAMGMRRGMRDLPYTAMWSTKRYRNWRVLNEEDGASVVFVPSLYEMDNNNRLYCAPRIGETYTTDSTDRAGWVIYAPDGGEKKIKELDITYDINLPTNWEARILSYDDPPFTSALQEWLVTTSGSGTATVTFATARDAAIFEIRNSTGSDSTPTGDTGDYYGKLTDVRVKTVDTSTVSPQDIIKELLSFIRAVNADQLLASEALIQDPGIDVLEAIYEDMDPADIINLLGSLGDNSTPPQPYIGGAWGRELFFWPRGTRGLNWSATQEGINLRLSLDLMNNSAYGVYTDERGRRQRTAVATDENTARYNLTRRAAVPVQSTSSATVAEGARDRFVEQNKDAKPRASIKIGRLRALGGGQWPKYLIRGGDTVSISNWPTGSGLLRETLQTFTVKGMRYNLDTDELEVYPDVDPATVDFLLARSLSRSTVVGADRWR